MKNQQRETRDLYQQVTDDIIEALESGVMPWIKPWNDAEAERIALRLPYNGESGRHYSGINILLLWAAQIKHGFKQAKQARTATDYLMQHLTVPHLAQAC
ncbi:protein of unknown function [Pasteurella testudinis DSM 23072]|uniref:N-terminal domain-containing protein n=1 Tax=Pasteurella testudinis DSM 23072 TaxID=1122938 RepID=A0A1W1UVZ4_9PAST|nr:ArdC family protein [Pasteurella testudinis]SMB85262.1 protein of unknown function [Pasteurella testudinis DSM 23072]SUB52148.1 DNA primase TraC [Pasteurella testudinis]